MQTWPFPANTACAALDWFTQTSMVGGLSVTEHTALAVMPHRPCGPSVVMIFTAADRCAMASRNILRLSISFMLSPGLRIRRDRGRDARENGAGAVIRRFAQKGVLRDDHGIANEALHPVVPVDCRDPGQPVSLLNHIRTHMGRVRGAQAQQARLLGRNRAAGRDRVPGLFGRFIEERAGAAPLRFGTTQFDAK